MKLYQEGFFEVDEETGVAKLPRDGDEDGGGKNGKCTTFEKWGSHTKMMKPVMVSMSKDWSTNILSIARPIKPPAAATGTESITIKG